MVYRRFADVLDADWHFDNKCPHWPELGTVQIRFLIPDHGERICKECIRLGQRPGIDSMPDVISTSLKRE